MTTSRRAKWGDGRIEVTAKWQHISARLNEGWPMTRIYEQHIDPAVISYSQFRRQVLNRLKKVDPPPAPSANQPERKGPIIVRPHRETGPVFTPAKHDDETWERLVGPRKPK